MKKNSLSIEKIKKILSDSDAKVICVCGKMASGKNYICAQLEQEGWKSLDADLLVHKAIETQEAKNQIEKNFASLCKEKGLSLKNADGTINRRELGKLLFENPHLLSIQEAILYPIIIQMTKDFIKENNKTILNATVLYKTPELLNLCSFIIYVKAPFLKRLIRCRKRDKLAFKLILKRFKSQKNLYKDYQNAAHKIPLLVLGN